MQEQASLSLGAEMREEERGDEQREVRGDEVVSEGKGEGARDVL